MAAIRLIRVSRMSSVLGAPTLQNLPAKARVSLRFTCRVPAGFSPEYGQLIGDLKIKPVVAAALNSPAVAPTQTQAQTSERGVPATIFLVIRSIVLRKLRMVRRPRSWSLIIQSLVEKIIINCRFLTLLGVVGTLFGSVLCFLEGVFLVIESYLRYFQAIFHHTDHVHIMHLLIGAIDMFLVGTAMLTFGTGLHVMFIGSRATKGNGLPIPPSNFFGLFYLKELPSWAAMKSIGQAKLKMGHALVLLLQVGVLENFKSIPLVTGLDLACFAGAIFVFSAGLFILSRLSA